MVRRGDVINFGAGRGPTYHYMAFELRRERWEWFRSGDCRPRWARDQLDAATWRLDRDSPLPAKGDREIHVLVDEEDCASGQDARDRLLRPLAHYGRNAVTLTYFIRPLRGAQTCPSNPPTPATVVLDEPLGDRALRDGGPYPPRRRLSAGEVSER